MGFERISSRALASGSRCATVVVERALGVEHHRPQLALHLDALGGEQRRVDPMLADVRMSARALAQAQRRGQAPGGVDRDHGDLLPAGGKPERERGRCRGLADAAAAEADADAHPGEACREARCRCSAAMPGS